MVYITECPRDAMQGVHEFIPTILKAEYLNALLRVGFDRLDFGSFVSAKAIPQLRDTAEVLDLLDTDGTDTKLLAIIANLRGAQEAVTFSQVDILGFPFSVSETFQLRNTNSTILASLDTTRKIADICHRHGKTPLVYLSMGFGNPYGDEWSPAIVADYAGQLWELGIKHLALADTVGSSTPESIIELFPFLTAAYPDVEWGLHLHSTPGSSVEKIEAALSVGCQRFDTALGGFGGCPMALDKLTGNIATESLLNVLAGQGVNAGLDMAIWQEAVLISNEVFK